MTFSAPWRKLVLLLHVVSSVGFIGAVAAFIALAVTGTTTADASLAAGSYQAMRVVTWGVVVPLAFASLLIGIVQSLGTPWGLFRYYWVILKLALTVVALAVLMLQTRTIDGLSAAAVSGDLASFGGAKVGMVLHSVGGLVVLVIATVLSVFKPRGLTRFGERAIAAER